MEAVVAVRALSIYDHPAMSCLQLADTILTTGTDRHDRTRRAVLADFYDPWGDELHTITCLVGDDGVLTSHHYAESGVAAGLMGDSQQGPPVDRGGVPLRVDILTVHDYAALEPLPWPTQQAPKQIRRRSVSAIELKRQTPSSA